MLTLMLMIVVIVSFVTFVIAALAVAITRKSTHPATVAYTRCVREREAEQTLTSNAETEQSAAESFAEERQRVEKSLRKITASLPVLGSTKTCPKCGGDKFSFEHRPIRYQIEDRGRYYAHFGDEAEHVAVTCRGCGWTWEERPLDFVVDQVEQQGESK
jgi:DNA-directed RNA polymerase subunit M/transcription elongation factor TFIIS